MAFSRILLLFIYGLGVAPLARADVRLPAILGSHMVLQRNSTVKLWGWCDPGEKITVKTDWDTTIVTAVGQSTAKWNLLLRTPADTKPHTLTITGKNTLVLEDVLLGEVWLCSGQSNMEWSGDRGIRQAIDESPRATNSAIRFFYVPKATADFPQEDTPARWVVCTPAAMKHFSALGYFFGQKLQQTLAAPIGLINANWEGTPAEVWTPAELITSDSILSRAAAKVLKEAPKWPTQAGLGYNAMIHPLANYALAGVIWYQGESNVDAADAYQQLFTTMIGAWRKAWQQDFPFYYVQLAPFGTSRGATNWALLKEAQTKAARLPRTGMVVIHDLVDSVSAIHPQNKKDVGVRLANYALADTYGKTGIPSKSPAYNRMKVEPGGIRIYFNDAGPGLMSKGGEPTEFTIASADGVFLPATATIQGNTLFVKNAALKNPVAVRFGFDNVAKPNLFSREGLPVGLFRTDDWPITGATKTN